MTQISPHLHTQRLSNSAMGVVCSTWVLHIQRCCRATGSLVSTMEVVGRVAEEHTSMMKLAKSLRQTACKAGYFQAACKAIAMPYVLQYSGRLCQQYSYFLLCISNIVSCGP